MSKKKINKHGDYGKWLLRKNSRKNKIYGNCKVYSKEGYLMFICIEKRANWYLNKVNEKTGIPLAFEIRHINPTINSLMEFFNIHPRSMKIQFTFEPKGGGHMGDKFYLSKKRNRCVVGGSTDISNLTMHHIIPYCYRKFMPDKYKKGNSHDVVPILNDEHYKYEREADKLKVELAKKYDAPVGGEKEVDHKLFYALKSARALQKHKEFMTEKKIKFHKDAIRNYSGKERVTQKLIDEIANMDFKKSTKIRDHGEVVIEKLMLGGEESMQEFVEMWRKHFIEHAEPKYMPRHWSVTRPVARQEPRKRKIISIWPFF